LPFAALQASPPRAFLRPSVGFARHRKAVQPECARSARAALIQIKQRGATGVGALGRRRRTTVT